MHPPGSGWLARPSRGGLAPPILCQLSWPTLPWVKGGRHDYVGIASAVPQIADDLLHRRSRRSRASKRHRAPLPRAAANCILGRTWRSLSCSFLALVLNKELEERIADLGRNGS